MNRALAVAVLCFAAATHLGAQAPRDDETTGPVIDTIIVVNHNIFASTDQAPGFLAGLVNALHRTTRANVIRRTILLEPGMHYDSAQVVESERLLRDLGVFRDVKFDTLRVGDRFALRVTTGDGWSTSLNLGYSVTDKSVSWLMSATERNLLGTATALSVALHHNPDRNNLSFLYQNAAFLSRRTALNLEYDDLSDGRRTVWSYGQGFYQTAARYSLQDSDEVAHNFVNVFKDNGKSAVYDRKALISVNTAGWAPLATSRDYLRLTLSSVFRREDYKLDSLPGNPGFIPIPDSLFPRHFYGSFGIAAERSHVRYAQIEHFNSFGRHEDLDLSQTAGVGVWVAPNGLGYGPHAGVAPRAHFQLSGAWPGGFVSLRAQALGMYTRSGLDSGRVTSALTAVTTSIPSQTLIFHLEGGAVTGTAPGGEFDLWRDGNGPRLYGAHVFTGSRMVWLALDDRITIASEVWSLFGLGVAPFFDWGGAWYGIQRPRTASDMGVAFRVGPTRSIGGDVIEFAVGYRAGPFIHSGQHWAVTLGTGVFYR
ncbi:MAG TPA: hypothetical protein VJN62_13420 [Gemmatimonadales bacterium]|nr:hypothetical protein [Gemmatimonadales bacterium]